jgi:long-chain-fatty-acid--CoA ligase ACSBG
MLLNRSSRGIITGIYTTNSVDSTLFVLERSGASIVVVDDVKQMEKVREVKKKMPHLKVVIQTREPFAESSEGFYRWEDLEKMDVSDLEEEYQRRLADINANDCCSLIFTSGTTGRPKVNLIMSLSHEDSDVNNSCFLTFFVGCDAES